MKKMNKLKLIAFILIVTIIASGCSLTYVPTNDSAFDLDTEVTGIRNKIMFDDVSEEPLNEGNGRELIKYADEEVTESDISVTIYAVEGELVDLQPKAVDPDDDEIGYDFTGPFNEVGLWQTQDGDAGKYLITISATDGDLVIKEYVLVIINTRNKGPIIECPKKVVVLETETVYLDCNPYDLEDDIFSVSYSGWMTSDTYTTTYDDSGEYTVLITAKDEQNNTAQEKIEVVVKNKNRLPMLSGVEDINAMETDVIVLDIEAVDSDNDEIILSYSPPFDSDGVWATYDGTAGVYTSYVQADDGTDTITESFRVFIDHINTRPVLSPIEDIVVQEGETININVNASDAEDDELAITFTGWMTSDTYTTTYDDAGEHYVKVTASDGQLEVSQNVKITVNNMNRPPVFVVPG